MITNEVQYRATKANLAKFDEAATNSKRRSPRMARPADAALARRGPCPGRRPPRGDRGVRPAAFRCGVRVEVTSLAELATLLVKARIVRGWTQRRLADALGIAEQQVQRYESSDYRSACLARICEARSSSEARSSACP